MSVAPVPWILFTDLDGTLLDLQTYTWQPARPALEALGRAGIPVILNSSKTRAEIETLRDAMRHDDPFIVENGAALFVPAHQAASLPGGRSEGAYRVVEWGTPYDRIVDALDRAARTAGVVVRGFHAMSAEEIAARCRLPLDAARRSKQREYDEPFVIVDEAAGALDRLEAVVQPLGLRLARGDRFHHLLGRHDKAVAARATTDLYRRAHGAVRTIALGDAPNDLEMLRAADLAVIVGSAHAAALAAALPRARLTAAGPGGWNQAVLDVLPHLTAGSPA